MTNTIISLKPARLAENELCSHQPGAQMRWHRIASPPGWLLVTPAQDWGCFQAAGPAPPAAAHPAAVGTSTAASTVNGRSE
jgi:hypothetical protein